MRQSSNNVGRERRRRQDNSLVFDLRHDSDDAEAGSRSSLRGAGLHAGPDIPKVCKRRGRLDRTSAFPAGYCSAPKSITPTTRGTEGQHVGSAVSFASASNPLTPKRHRRASRGAREHVCVIPGRPRRSSQRLVSVPPAPSVPTATAAARPVRIAPERPPCLAISTPRPFALASLAASPGRRVRNGVVYAPRRPPGPPLSYEKASKRIEWMP